MNAYYCWIHPFFPILPPPLSWPCVDRPSARVRNASEAFTPSSPLALAILAIVVVIAHPDDPHPEDPASVIFRREISQRYANSCIDAIDSGAELLLSFINPAEALSISSAGNSPRRTSFAPNVPTGISDDLESLRELTAAPLRARGSHRFNALRRVFLRPERQYTADEAEERSSSRSSDRAGTPRRRWRGRSHGRGSSASLVDDGEHPRRRLEYIS